MNCFLLLWDLNLFDMYFLFVWNRDLILYINYVLIKNMQVSFHIFVIHWLCNGSKTSQHPNNHGVCSVQHPKDLCIVNSSWVMLCNLCQTDASRRNALIVGISISAGVILLGACIFVWKMKSKKALTGTRRELLILFVWLKPKLIVIVFYLICNLYGWQLDSRCRSRVHIGPKFDLLNPKQLYQPLFCTFCCRWLYFFFLKLHCFWSWTDIPLTKKKRL